MDPLIRFSSLVRHGLRFRSRLDRIKGDADTPGFVWYPYDSFANLFPLEQLRRKAGLTMADMAGTRPLLDLGTADGALAFLFESLGYTVHACDHADTNINRMEGVRRVAAALGSQIKIDDIDLDCGWIPKCEYGLALFLGTLYPLKNRSGSWSGYPRTRGSASAAPGLQVGVRIGPWNSAACRPPIYWDRTNATETQPTIGCSHHPAWCAWPSAADGACEPR